MIIFGNDIIIRQIVHTSRLIYLHRGPCNEFDYYEDPVTAIRSVTLIPSPTLSFLR